MKDVWDVYDETGRAVAGGYPSRSAAWQGIAKDARHRFKFVKREAKLDSGNSDPLREKEWNERLVKSRNENYAAGFKAGLEAAARKSDAMGCVECADDIRALSPPPSATVQPDGKACPKCGKELSSEPDVILPSKPPKKEVHCAACGYSGYVWA